MAPARSAVIAIADTYIQGGLVQKDLKQIKLAPDVFRHENGWDTGPNAATINDQLSWAHEALHGVRDQRWFVEGNEAFSIFELTMAEGRRVGPIMEYFRVEGGKIKEISPTFQAASFGFNFLAPAKAAWLRPQAKKERKGASAGTMELAEQYFTALRRHEPGKAPVGEDATLTENGKLVATGRAATIQWLTAGVYAQLDKVQILKSVIEAKEGVLRFRFDLQDGRMLIGSQHVRTHGGLIRELFSNYGEGPSEAEVVKLKGRTENPPPALP